MNTIRNQIPRYSRRDNKLSLLLIIKAIGGFSAKVKFTLIAALTIGMLSACESALISMLNLTEVTKIVVKNDKLYIADLLNSKTFGQMQRVIATNQQIDTLVFTAMEGSIDDEVTFKIGRWIRKQGLNTHLLRKASSHLVPLTFISPA